MSSKLTGDNRVSTRLKAGLFEHAIHGLLLFFIGGAHEQVCGVGYGFSAGEEGPMVVFLRYQGASSTEATSSKWSTIESEATGALSSVSFHGQNFEKRGLSGSRRTHDG